jgi:hypothetical protein
MISLMAMRKSSTVQIFYYYLLSEALAEKLAEVGELTITGKRYKNLTEQPLANSQKK